MLPELGLRCVHGERVNYRDSRSSQRDVTVPSAFSKHGGLSANGIAKGQREDGNVF